MREILFRAKDEASNKWVYGYYVHLPSAAGSVHIMQVPAGNPDENNTTYYIIPETVGEYTGVTDKNGKKIFEGDIISYFDRDFLNSEVVFYKNAFMFRFISEYVQKIRQQKYDLIFQNVSICGKVIGNIHDNPELVEG